MPARTTGETPALRSKWYGAKVKAGRGVLPAHALSQGCQEVGCGELGVEAAMLVSSDDGEEAVRERGYVGGSAGGGQADDSARRFADEGGVDIAETVHFGGIKKAEMDASVLHHAEEFAHTEALGGAED